MKPSFCHCCALFLAVTMSAANASADVVVVVSSRSTVTNLSAEQVKKIFLGKSKTFPSGSNVSPVDQAEGSTARDEFYARVVNKSPSQVSAYWAKIIFTGDGQPPQQLGDSVDVKKAVALNPGAIGYIDKGAADGSVRIILAP